jgi:hypothetical protein
MIINSLKRQVHESLSRQDASLNGPQCQKFLLVDLYALLDKSLLDGASSGGLIKRQAQKPDNIYEIDSQTNP